MPRQARQNAESGVYHVMLRGVNRDAIFVEDDDYERFLSALLQVRDASGCAVLAYCLMRNHVHLIVRTGPEPIGSVMKRLGIRYASWFNRKYGRVGHLFQDRFKSVPVDEDAYLFALVRYVWRNPIEAGLVSRAEDYPWSSRRLLGRASDLVTESELIRLLPPGSLADEPSNPSQVADISVSAATPRRTAQDVAAQLRKSCGVVAPVGFLTLPRSVQARAVAELRTRQVSYAQIARATGMSPSSVRRLHVSRGSTEGAQERALRLVQPAGGPEGNADPTADRQREGTVPDHPQ